MPIHYLLINLKQMDKLRTILAVFGLVLIGFVGGFFTHRQMVTKEMQRVVRLGEAPMFRQHLVRALQPDVEQKVQIDKILDAHVKEMRSLMQNSRQERSQLVQQLEQKLEPILTEEQQTTLKNFNQRFKRPPPGAGHSRERRGENRR